MSGPRRRCLNAATVASFRTVSTPLIVVTCRSAIIPSSMWFVRLDIAPDARGLQLRDHLLSEHPNRFQGLLVRGTARLAKADNEIIRLDLRLPPLQLCQTVLG